VGPGCVGATGRLLNAGLPLWTALGGSGAELAAAEALADAEGAAEALADAEGAAEALADELAEGIPDTATPGDAVAWTAAEGATITTGAWAVFATTHAAPSTTMTNPPPATNGISPRFAGATGAGCETI